MLSIGYDIGSSSIKAALVDLDTGSTIDLVQYPKVEMKIHSSQSGWAEQNPKDWWEAVCNCTASLLSRNSVDRSLIKSIGISYQMHALILIDKNYKVLRPSIIWCDSRAIEIGNTAYDKLGELYCNESLLNSPGNFTASKLKWVKDYEPDIFDKIYKVLLPGDYITMKLTGELSTTITGLSEGVFWNFKEGKIADKLVDYLGISDDLFPDVKSSTELYGVVSNKASKETGLPAGIAVSYKAGDQPNNAMSLSVLNPGEVAATGGTSGVVYGVVDKLISDNQNRINSFAHVNHKNDNIRIGQLLCINGAGSQYAWIKNQLTSETKSYKDLEEAIGKIPVGSDDLRIIPFGNGAERMIQNKLTGAQVNNLQFHLHTKTHLIRAALEGIAFSFIYGIKVLEELGLDIKKIKVGNDNLFQSDIFSMTISNLLKTEIHMFDTNGAAGAAKASGIGINKYNSFEEAMSTSHKVKTYSPDNSNDEYIDAYAKWERDLIKLIKD